MNWAHIHLAFNHVPVILVPVSGLILMLATFRRSAELARMGGGMLALTAVLGVGVYFTGEPAEDVVENMSGVSKPAIETHEEAAEAAVIATAVAGLLALGFLIAERRRDSRATVLLVATLVATLVAAGLMARAANLGGAIRHPEITAAGGEGAAAVRPVVD